MESPGINLLTCGTLFHSVNRMTLLIRVQVTALKQINIREILIMILDRFQGFSKGLYRNEATDFCQERF